MNDGKRRLRGSCHCGNIRFVFITDKTDDELPKRECQCSFCLQHGRISTSDPGGEMLVSIADTEKVTKYRFGHRTADFYGSDIEPPISTCAGIAARSPW